MVSDNCKFTNMVSTIFSRYLEREAPTSLLATLLRQAFALRPMSNAVRILLPTPHTVGHALTRRDESMYVRAARTDGDTSPASAEAGITSRLT
jgi:hypothetical protein